MKAVNLHKAFKTIEVFYDTRCGMCCTFIEWLEKQERACELVSYDYQSGEAETVFPGLVDYHPEKMMVVRVDGEVVYQGGEGWVCCLWSCNKYQDVAKKMNSKLLLPMAKKFCYLVSNHRFKISKLFFRKKNKEITDEIEAEQKKNKEIECEGGCE